MIRSHQDRCAFRVNAVLVALLVLAPFGAHAPVASATSDQVSTSRTMLVTEKDDGQPKKWPDTSWSQKQPGMHCRPRTSRKCDIFAQYRGMAAYLRYVGRPNPAARWSRSESRFIRRHPTIDKRMGSLSIFRHPGKRSFKKSVQTHRDHRAGLARGGGPNYCTTLTISRLVESAIFRSDLFTAYHKVRWCWDANVVYDFNHGNWTEIDVHDGYTIVNNGEIDRHDGDLPTSEWYTSQSYSICNCIAKFGAIGQWQPLWRVWARPGGGYDWEAHW